MPDYLWLKWLHIISATLLFGTSLGSVFYVLRAHFSRDISAITFALKTATFANWALILPAVIIQPLSGLALADIGNFSLSNTWLWSSLALFTLLVLCWIPVTWLQLRLQRITLGAYQNGGTLPQLYHSYMRLWLWLSWPIFTASIITFQLMVFKPCY